MSPLIYTWQRLMRLLTSIFESSDMRKIIRSIIQNLTHIDDNKPYFQGLQLMHKIHYGIRFC